MINPDIAALIRAALNADPAARPTSRECLKGLDATIQQMLSRSTIETPDGREVSDQAALAAWCEQHWNEAIRPSLFGSLPRAAGPPVAGEAA